MTPSLPDEPHVFALAGLPGSGKSTAADIIVSELQHRMERATHFEVSDFCRTLYEERVGGETDDNDLGRWTAELKAEHGNGYILREMAKTIDGEGMPHVAISGLRSPEEAEAVRGVFGPENVTVIAIWTLPDARFERKYGEPPRSNHPKYPEFKERNQREIHDWRCVEFFMEDGPADYIVPNNESLGALELRLNGILKEGALDEPTVIVSTLRDSPFVDGSTEEMVAQYL